MRESRHAWVRCDVPASAADGRIRSGGAGVFTAPGQAETCALKTSPVSRGPSSLQLGEVPGYRKRARRDHCLVASKVTRQPLGFSVVGSASYVPSRIMVRPPSVAKTPPIELPPQLLRVENDPSAFRGPV